ncbi:MAG: aldehyde dehydrogenase family protein, partial [Bryobacteraceae bacterium]
MQLELPLSRPELILNCALIGGERKPASSGRRFEVLNPATLAALGSVPDCAAEDAEAAESAAVAAFPQWRARTAKERSAILERWFALMKENHED